MICFHSLLLFCSREKYILQKKFKGLGEKSCKL